MFHVIKNILSPKRQSVWGHAYKNLPIKSDYRVHDVAFAQVKERFVTTDTFKALDIATGTGAFAQRLADNFPNCEVEANDFENQALLKNFKKSRIDLNGSFARQFGLASYDLVVALEILEHLENPWNFLGEARKLLRPDGLLVLSTPNVDSTLDRLNYLIHGHALYFGEHGYIHSGGHITQVPDWLFKKIAGQSGFSTVKRIDGVDTSPHYGPIVYLKLILALPFVLLSRDRNDRSINIYVCK